MLRPWKYRALPIAATIALLAGTLPALRPRTISSSRPPALDTASVDPGALEVLARIAPRAHVLAAIVVDVDHDGDLDVVARTTDDVLAIWVNEGNGRFEDYQPSAAPGITAASEVSAPDSPGQAPATPARTGHDAYLIASGFARPPTPKSTGPVIARAVRLDQSRNATSDRAPPSVSSL